MPYGGCIIVLSDDRPPNTCADRCIAMPNGHDHGQARTRPSETETALPYFLVCNKYVHI